MSPRHYQDILKSSSYNGAIHYQGVKYNFAFYNTSQKKLFIFNPKSKQDTLTAEIDVILLQILNDLIKNNYLAWLTEANDLFDNGGVIIVNSQGNFYTILGWVIHYCISGPWVITNIKILSLKRFLLSQEYFQLYKILT